MSEAPALSIILAGYDLDETRVVRSLFRSQTVAARLELVLVLPQPLDEGTMPDLFDGLWGGQVLPLEFCSRGDANAAGVRAARAPVVVLAEDHCYPDADWAEALLEDHQGPWAVVGPQVRNANPATRTSQADFVIGYGPWSTLEAAGEASFLPGHNSSYERDLLLACGDQLELMLSGETILHWKLLERGHRLLLSRRAVVRHLNFSQPAVFRRAQFLNGRLFAAVRAVRWGMARRMAYVLGSPLIPWVRAWRLRACLGGAGNESTPWGALPTLLLGLYIDAAGQALGYAAGSGEAVGKLAGYEFRRTRFVLRGERDAVEAQLGHTA